jgi:hypothetical protein
MGKKEEEEEEEEEEDPSLWSTARICLWKAGRSCRR